MLYVLLLSWLGEHVPHYYSRFVDVAGPYLSVMWLRLHAGAVYVLDVTAPYRDWISQQIVVYLQWVSIIGNARAAFIR